MKLTPQYPMQTGGNMHAWCNPNRNFKHAFLRLNLACEPDRYPGIVIVADENLRNALAIEVENLQEELPALLRAAPEKSVVYWWLEQDKDKRQRVLSNLTSRPEFADIR